MVILSEHHINKIANYICSVNLDQISCQYADYRWTPGSSWDVALKSNNMKQLEYLRSEELLYKLRNKKDFFVDVLLNTNEVIQLEETDDNFIIKFRYIDEDLNLYIKCTFKMGGTNRILILYSKSYFSL